MFLVTGLGVSPGIAAGRAAGRPARGAAGPLSGRRRTRPRRAVAPHRRAGALAPPARGDRRPARRRRRAGRRLALRGAAADARRPDARRPRRAVRARRAPQRRVGAARAAGRARRRHRRAPTIRICASAHGDVRDVVERLVGNLRWESRGIVVPEGSEPWVLVADELAPSTVAQVDWSRAAGFVTEARQLGLRTPPSWRARSAFPRWSASPGATTAHSARRVGRCSTARQGSAWSTATRRRGPTGTARTWTRRRSCAGSAPHPGRSPARPGPWTASTSGSTPTSSGPTSSPTSSPAAPRTSACSDRRVLLARRRPRPGRGRAVRDLPAHPRRRRRGEVTIRTSFDAGARARSGGGHPRPAHAAGRRRPATRSSRSRFARCCAPAHRRPAAHPAAVRHRRRRPALRAGRDRPRRRGAPSRRRRGAGGAGRRHGRSAGGGADRRSPGARGRLPQRRHQRPDRVHAGRRSRRRLGVALLRSAAPVDAAPAALRRPRRRCGTHARVRCAARWPRIRARWRCWSAWASASSAWRPAAHARWRGRCSRPASPMRDARRLAREAFRPDEQTERRAGATPIRDIMDIRAARLTGRATVARATQRRDFRGRHRQSARVEKPWGYELHWAKTDRYVGKLIHVNKGHALSLQYHNKKDETIYLTPGCSCSRSARATARQARDARPANPSTSRRRPSTA